MAGGGYEFSPSMTMLRRNNQFQFSQRDPHYLSTLANLFDTLTVECRCVRVCVISVRVCDKCEGGSWAVELEAIYVYLIYVIYCIGFSAW